MTDVKKELEPLWTVPKLAAYLSVSPGTVYHWISDGKYIDPATIIRIGKQVRIPRSEVERIAGKIKGNLQTK